MARLTDPILVLARWAQWLCSLKGGLRCLHRAVIAFPAHEAHSLLHLARPEHHCAHGVFRRCVSSHETLPQPPGA
eukprot:scaffold473_cov257-Pinguiococcus_pyrenoidosus.AAC.6